VVFIDYLNNNVDLLIYCIKQKYQLASVGEINVKILL
jgi:hypothetical protein